VRHADVCADIQRCDVALTGAGDEAVAVILAPLARYFSRTLPADWSDADGNPGSTTLMYLDRLGQLPPDLLRIAATAALDHCEFFPTIAKLRGFVEAELRERNDALLRLRAAELYARLRERRAA
jgi:hypothetical protein